MSKIDVGISTGLMVQTFSSADALDANLEQKVYLGNEERFGSNSGKA